jgi:hypothetical protein
MQGVKVGAMRIKQFQHTSVCLTMLIACYRLRIRLVTMNMKYVGFLVESLGCRKVEDVAYQKYSKPVDSLL